MRKQKTLTTKLNKIKQRSETLTHTQKKKERKEKKGKRSKKIHT